MVFMLWALTAHRSTCRGYRLLIKGSDNPSPRWRDVGTVYSKNAHRLSQSRIVVTSGARGVVEKAESCLPAFVSYSREDSEFAARLVKDLTAAGVAVWLDQVNITGGERWDRAIEVALAGCGRILVILSPAAVGSENVMDEISFAIEERKEIVPVLYQECAVPFRLRRFHHIDFRSDYQSGLQKLLSTLSPGLQVAEPADGDAMADRGDSYFFGKGMPQDYQKAREWYKKGAAAGSARAMYCLGNMYDHASGYFGENEQMDCKLARSWYEKSAAAGYADAMAILGYHYEHGYEIDEDYGRALYWYQRGAEAGSGHAMAGLGGLYEDGKGVRQDLAKARHWYENGAEAGSGEAMARLGDLYYRGQGVNQDYEKARIWCEKAVAAGACNLEAIFDLEVIYRNGYGVEKNEDLASMWAAKYYIAGDCMPGEPRRLVMVRWK
jgi:TPR repeat protein